MSPTLIVIAFACGAVAMVLRLPPLVGFLAAGFVLKAMGYELTDDLQTVANLGVTLLLFTIGLKLRVKTLLRGEVWGAATLHMLGSTIALAALLGVFKVAGLYLIADTPWLAVLLLGFTLSFSSTVFAIKVLEDRGEAQSLYGRIAIGVLIMQDIFAVLFLTSTKSLPSPWAALLLLLIPLAPLLRAGLGKIGHGEMQVLYGIFLALVVGYALFDWMGVKGDLGALILGMLLAPHAEAPSLAKELFNLKELFLVGFFLSIGLGGVPTWPAVGLAAMLLLLVPVTGVLTAVAFAAYRLRPRTNILATLSLANFSEFGLVVAVVAASKGWLDGDWLVVLSLALAGSLVLASPLNSFSEELTEKLSRYIPKIAPEQLHPGDRPIEVGDAEVIVLGMGRVGGGAYSRLTDEFGLRVLGVDNSDDRVARLRERGVNALEGDAADAEFWRKIAVSRDVKLVVLAMPLFDANRAALDQLQHSTFGGHVAAIVHRESEGDELLEMGADSVHNLYRVAGQELADDAMRLIAEAAR